MADKAPGERQKVVVEDYRRVFELIYWLWRRLEKEGGERERE